MSLRHAFAADPQLLVAGLGGIMKAFDENGNELPPGQTGDHNDAPVTRTHHRIKTLGSWTYKRLDDGTYTWTSLLERSLWHATKLDRAAVLVNAQGAWNALGGDQKAGLGMKILDIYGMTETTGAFTANTPAEFAAYIKAAQMQGASAPRILPVRILGAKAARGDQQLAAGRRHRAPAPADAAPPAEVAS